MPPSTCPLHHRLLTEISPCKSKTQLITSLPKRVISHPSEISCHNSRLESSSYCTFTPFCTTTQAWFKLCQWRLNQPPFLQSALNRAERMVLLYSRWEHLIHVPCWHIGQNLNPASVILSVHFPAVPPVVPSILCALCMALIC